MKTTRFLIRLGLLSLAFLYGPTVRAGDFKLVKKDQVLSLYERWILNDEGEQVRELKAVFLVKTDINSVTRLLTDQKKGAEWNRNILSYRVLRGQDPASWTTYISYDIPWPFDNQDCLLQYQLEKRGTAGKPTEITFRSTVASGFPVAADLDRITGVRGKWLMTKEENGMLRITYLITTNRNKQIPRWVSDPIIHNNVFYSMTAFKRLLEQPASSRARLHGGSMSPDPMLQIMLYSRGNNISDPDPPEIRDRELAADPSKKCNTEIL